MEKKELYKLALPFVRGVGDINAKKLLSIFDNPENLFTASLSDLKLSLKNVGIKPQTLYANLKTAVERAETELKYIYSNDINFVTALDEDYPKRLLSCSDSPYVIYYSGKNTFNSEKILAVVGTRNATSYGRDFCVDFIKDLAQKYPDTVIVSGLAYGIDVISHKEALKNNLKTWAVLGHSLEFIYPAAHRNIAADIIKSEGAIISDYPSQSKVDPANFVRRNRIVAGMCDALLIVESGTKGGAMITANIANHYGKDVFAVPGNLNLKYSKGCNMLIKTDRANLIQSIDDLEHIMNWKSNKNIQEQTAIDIDIDLPPEEATIVKILSNCEFLDIDNLIRQANIDSNVISLSLLQLEMRGIVRALPGKIFTLKKK